MLTISSFGSDSYLPLTILVKLRVIFYVSTTMILLYDKKLFLKCFMTTKSSVIGIHHIVELDLKQLTDMLQVLNKQLLIYQEYIILQVV